MDYVAAGFEGLSEAIVAQAGRDYLEVKKRLHRIDQFKKEEKKLTLELKRLNRFFNSEWFRSLSAVDNKWLVEQLNKEYENWLREEEKLTIFDRTIGA